LLKNEARYAHLPSSQQQNHFSLGVIHQWQVGYLVAPDFVATIFSFFSQHPLCPYTVNPVPSSELITNKMWCGQKSVFFIVIEALASGLYELFSKELTKHDKVEATLTVSSEPTMIIGHCSEPSPKPFFCSVDGLFEQVALDNITDHTAVD
jgi:hypothetical protein